MRRISSKITFVQKRVFPVIWFGFLFIFMVGATAAMVAKGQYHFEFLLIPGVMAVFGFILMKKLVFNLADEVWDDGDALIVKNQSREERIQLANIMNVSSSMLTNPQRVTLTLREPCALGKEIAFSPPARFLRFSEHPLVTDLIQRIDAARRS